METTQQPSSSKRQQKKAGLKTSKNIPLQTKSEEETQSKKWEKSTLIKLSSQGGTARTLALEVNIPEEAQKQQRHQAVNIALEMTAAGRDYLLKECAELRMRNKACDTVIEGLKIRNAKAQSNYNALKEENKHLYLWPFSLCTDQELVAKLAILEEENFMLRQKNLDLLREEGKKLWINIKQKYQQNKETSQEEQEVMSVCGWLIGTILKVERACLERERVSCARILQENKDLKAKLFKLERGEEALDNQVQLQKKIESLKYTAHDFQREVIYLRERLEQIETLKERMDEKIHEESAELQTYMGALTDNATQALNQYMKIETQLKERISILENRLKEKEQQEKNLLEQNQKLEEKHGQEQSALANLKKELEVLKRRIKKLNEEKQLLEKNQKEQELELRKETAKEIQSLRDQLATAEKAKAEKYKKSSSQFKLLKAENSRLKQQAEEKDQKLVDLKASHLLEQENWQKGKRKSEDSIKALETHSQELEEKLKVIEEALLTEKTEKQISTQLLGEKAELEEKRNGSEARLLAVEKQLTDESQKLKAAEESAITLRKSLNLALEEKEAANKALKKAAESQSLNPIKENEKLQASVKTLKEDISVLRKALDGKMEVVQSLESQIKKTTDGNNSTIQGLINIIWEREVMICQLLDVNHGWKIYTEVTVNQLAQEIAMTQSALREREGSIGQFAIAASLQFARITDEWCERINTSQPVGPSTMLQAVTDFLASASAERNA